MALRTDLSLIAEMIQPNTKLLDIGCGEGVLLEHLFIEKQVDGCGIELCQANVTRCLKKGISVIQGNADTDLLFYPPASFDYVISSQVIQATHNPKKVLSECLRIGKNVIISLPNFGYWRNRYYLLNKGRMPVTETLSYEWYETPNIHFCTLNDFKILCDELECTIKAALFIGAGNQLVSGGIKGQFPNFFAEQGIFLLQK